MTDTRDAVLAAADRLIDAFARHDTEAYFATFAPEASFIFHNLDRPLLSRADYRSEWALWETRDGFRVLGCRSTDKHVHIKDDTAIFIHTIITDLNQRGEIVHNIERETIVFQRDADGAWMAIHEHLSAKPE